MPEPSDHHDVPPLPTAAGAASASTAPGLRPAGCALPAVLGCGCLTLLTGFGLLLVVANAQSLIEWQLRPLRRAVESGLPGDLGEAERRRFASAFDALPAALTSGSLDAGTVWSFQRQLAEAAAAGQSGTLDRDTALALLRSLESLVSSTEPDRGGGEREGGRPGEVEARIEGGWRAEATA